MRRITAHHDYSLKLRLAAEKNIQKSAKPFNGQHWRRRWWAVFRGRRFSGIGGRGLITITIIVLVLVLVLWGGDSCGRKRTWAWRWGGGGQEVGEPFGSVLLEKIEVFLLLVGGVHGNHLITAYADTGQERALIIGGRHFLILPMKPVCFCS